MELTDTAQGIAEIQIGVLSQKTTSERLALTLELSDMVIRLSRRAIERANPKFSDEEVTCLFVELHYGKELANRVRQYLNLEKLP